MLVRWRGSNWPAMFSRALLESLGVARIMKQFSFIVVGLFGGVAGPGAVEGAVEAGEVGDALDNEDAMVAR